MGTECGSIIVCLWLIVADAYTYEPHCGYNAKHTGGKACLCVV